MTPAAARTSHSPRPDQSPGALSQPLAALLSRYPDLSPEELEKLATTLETAPLLEVGLLSGDDHLGPKLRRFRAEQGALLRTPWWRYLLFIAAWVIPILLVVLVSMAR